MPGVPGRVSDDSDLAELQREKNASFELGHISQLRDISDELRERAGDTYAKSDTRKGVDKARQLKELAQEFEERADERREKWDGKYSDD